MDEEKKTFILDGHVTNLNSVKKFLNQIRTYLVTTINTAVNTRKIQSWKLHIFANCHIPTLQHISN
jgi:hypothetical protein